MGNYWPTEFTGTSHATGKKPSSRWQIFQFEANSYFSSWKETDMMSVFWPMCGLGPGEGPQLASDAMSEENLTDPAGS